MKENKNHKVGRHADCRQKCKLITINIQLFKLTSNEPLCSFNKMRIKKK